MNTIEAYSSVSVVDLTDVGVINMYCTSNHPTSVIYDPNQGTYTPDWSVNNLIITPVISYNGENVSPDSQDVVVTFTRREGSSPATELQTGETVSNGVLTVSANKLADIISGLLTYICSVTYTDPESNVPITAQSTMTFTKISGGANIRSASISGESVFLYNSNRHVIGSRQITLTATLANVTINRWEYKTSDGTFAPYPVTEGINDSNTAITLVVDESEQDIWLNGRSATIRLTTSDQTVFDIHEIAKIYDGAEGDETISIVLSNENHYLPCDVNGNVKSWAGSPTQIHIYEGGVDITYLWTITVANGTGLTGTYDSATYTYTPSALTEVSSYADFTCSREDHADITKRYTITKQTAGADGTDATIYEVVPEYYAINRDESGAYTPATITFNAYSKTGDSLTKSAYNGRFIISETSDGGETYTTTYTSGIDESQKVYTPSAGINAIKCALYEAGDTAVELDSQSVVVTNDGATGQTGPSGDNGLSVGLTNYSDVIPCTHEGVVAETRTVSIPFYAYKGIDRVAATATVGTLPSGVAVTSNVPSTTTNNGMIVLSIAAGTTFGQASLLTGDFTITISVDNKSFDCKYSWTKSLQPIDGETPGIMQLYSEDGGTVAVGRDSTVKVNLIYGANSVTPDAVEWREFKNGSYQVISGETGTSITITNAMVTDQMWLKCIATYNGTSYEAYYTVNDTTDPYSSYTFATVREFKNNVGFGAVYTRVYQNNLEVDPIKSTTFSSTPPTTAESGDYYYHLDQVSKTCVLKIYDGGTWVNATDTDELTYRYFRMNAQGTPLDTTEPYHVGRCFYVDPSIINNRMQFFCEISD